jgi:hypothetical protein
MPGLIDLVGRRFARLLVTAYAGHEKWHCVCDCDTAVVVHGKSLRGGITRSCGCLNRELASARLIDLAGKRFGRLVVGAYVGDGKWSCTCDCGTVVVVRGYDLRGGDTKSCGCLARELSRARLTTHGMSRSREYRTWQGMKQRCLNPRAPNFDNYGGRGIPIYADYIPSFEAWFADAGPRPLDTSLDRPDVNGGYLPGNMQWADAKQQARNKRLRRKSTTVKRRQPEPPSSLDDDPPF